MIIESLILSLSGYSLKGHSPDISPILICLNTIEYFCKMVKYNDKNLKEKIVIS